MEAFPFLVVGVAWGLFALGEWIAVKILVRKDRRL